MALTNHSRRDGEGKGEGGVSRPHVTTAAADLPLPAAREIRETRERPLPGESVPTDRPGDRGGETKRKIMIAGTPKHNDNIHCWARGEKGGRARATDGEMDGWMDGWMTG